MTVSEATTRTAGASLARPQSVLRSHGTLSANGIVVAVAAGELTEERHLQRPGRRLARRLGPWRLRAMQHARLDV